MERIGWREWIALPELGIKHIKVKVDSGARSASLHAYDVETFLHAGEEFVRFKVHYLQHRDTKFVEATSRLVEHRLIKSSSGHESIRPVILTQMQFLGVNWTIEVTLADREQMGFRMLLGREAIRGRYLIDPDRSYYGGKPTKIKR